MVQNMEIVCHKDWGIGIVVKRENLENGNFVEVSEGGQVSHRALR